MDDSEKWHSPRSKAVFSMIPTYGIYTLCLRFEFYFKGCSDVSTTMSIFISLPKGTLIFSGQTGGEGLTQRWLDRSGCSPGSRDFWGC